MRWLLVLLVACGGAPIAGAPHDAVAIVEAGEMPRRIVRYAFTQGAIGYTESTAKATHVLAFTNTVLENGVQRTEQPTMRLVQRVVVNEVMGTDAELASTLTDARLLDDVVSDPRGQLSRDVAAAKGTTTSWKMSQRGVVKDVVQPIPDVDTRGMSVVFPDGEIGVGAIWKVTSHERADGVLWDQTSTFRLRAVTDTHASVDIEIKRTARSQALSVEPTATTTLKSGTGKSTATLLVSLGGLSAVGTAHSSFEIHLAIVQKGLRITATRTTTIDAASKDLTPKTPVDPPNAPTEVPAGAP